MSFSSLDSFAFTKGLETLVMSTKPVESEKKPDVKPQQPVKPEPVGEPVTVAESAKAETSANDGRKRKGKDLGDAE